MSKKKSIIFIYAIITWIITFLITEMLISGVLMKSHPTIKIIIIMAVLYAILSLGFGILLYYTNWWTVIVAAFIYGIIYELLIAKTIQSIGEFVGFGILYAVIFGIGALITSSRKRKSKRRKGGKR